MTFYERFAAQLKNLPSFPNGIAGEAADQAQAAIINLNSLSNFPPASAEPPWRGHPGGGGPVLGFDVFVK